MQKKRSLLFLLLAMLIFSVLPVSAAAPKLSKTSLKLTVGKSATLKVKNTKKKVNWKSSKKSVATVKNGKVKALRAGKTTITATVDGKKFTCKVTVKDVKAKSVKLNKKSLNLEVGESETLKATVLPSTANQTLTWKSNNKKIAEVDQNGMVTGKKIGNATITAKTKNGKTKNIKVTVKKSTATRITSMTITGKKSLSVNDSMKLAVSYEPANPGMGFLWSSSNEKVATVSSSGLVTAHSAGTVTITATTNNALKQSASVTIKVSKAANTVTDGAETERNHSTPTTDPTKLVVVGIAAECSLTEASSVNSVNSSNLTVYDCYSDGTRKTTSSYTIAGTSKDGYYVYTIKKVNTSFSTTVSVKMTAKKLTGISATCSLSSINSVSDVTADAVTVTGTYSDGSTKKLSAYSLSGRYVSSRNAFNFTVTSTDGKLTATFSVNKTVSTATLTDVEVSCKYTEVEAGYSFETSDFTVNGIYSDGTKKNVGFKVGIAYADGKYVATITAEGFTKTIDIAVKKSESTNPVVTGLKYSLSPSYVYVNESLASGQLKITATYSDGTVKDVTDYESDFTVQTTPGSYSFTVKWNNFTKTIPLTVKEKSTEVTLTGMDAKFNRAYIFSDETPTISDVAVTGTYSDGSTAAITDFTIDFTPATSHKGYAVVTVHYGKLELSLNVLSYVKTEVKSVEFRFKQDPVKVGADLDKSKITVIATDYAGNQTTVTDFTTDFAPKSEAGTYSFSVTYKGFTESFDVDVVE